MKDLLIKLFFFTAIFVGGSGVALIMSSLGTNSSNVLTVKPALPKATVIITVDGYDGRNAPKEIIKWIKQGYQIDHVVGSGQYSYQNIILVKY